MSGVVQLIFLLHSSRPAKKENKQWHSRPSDLILIIFSLTSVMGADTKLNKYFLFTEEILYPKYFDRMELCCCPLYFRFHTYYIARPSELAYKGSARRVGIERFASPPDPKTPKVNNVKRFYCDSSRITFLTAVAC